MNRIKILILVKLFTVFSIINCETKNSLHVRDKRKNKISCVKPVSILTGAIGFIGAGIYFLKNHQQKNISKNVSNNNLNHLFNETILKTKLCNQFDIEIEQKTQILEDCENKKQNRKNKKNCFNTFYNGYNEFLEIDYNNTKFNHTKHCLISIIPCKKSFSKLYKIYTKNRKHRETIFCKSAINSKQISYDNSFKIIQFENIIDYYQYHWQGNDLIRYEMLKTSINITNMFNPLSIFEITKNGDYEFIYNLLKKNDKINFFMGKGILKYIVSNDTSGQILKNYLKKSIFQYSILNEYLSSLEYKIDKYTLENINKRRKDFDYISQELFEKYIKIILNKIKSNINTKLYLKIIGIVYRNNKTRTFITSKQIFNNEITKIKNKFNENIKIPNNLESYDIYDLLYKKGTSFKTHRYSIDIKNMKFKFKNINEYFDFIANDDPLYKLSVIEYLNLLHNLKCSKITDKENKEQCIDDKLNLNLNEIYEAYQYLYPLEFRVGKIEIGDKIWENIIIEFNPQLECILKYFGPRDNNNDYKSYRIYKIFISIAEDRNQKCINTPKYFIRWGHKL